MKLNFKQSLELPINLLSLHKHLKLTTMENKNTIKYYTKVWELLPEFK